MAAAKNKSQKTKTQKANNTTDIPGSIPNPGNNMLRVVISIALMIGLITGYFAMFGTITIDNQSGKTVSNLIVSFNGSETMKVESLESGKTASFSYSHFRVKKVDVEYSAPGFKTRCGFTARLFPRFVATIEEGGALKSPQKEVSEQSQITTGN